MSVSVYIPYLSDNIPLHLQVISLAVVCLIVHFLYATINEQKPWKGFRIASLPGNGLRPIATWIHQGRSLILEGCKSSGPFQIITGTGPKIVLPNKFAEEVKHDSRLSLRKAFSKEFFFQYPGFEGFAHNHQAVDHLPDVLRTKLTTSLGLVVTDLVDETTETIKDTFGERTEWQEVVLKQNLLDMVSRLSSRVFLGLPLCRDERWLQISKEYAVDSVAAARSLRATPPFLRPFIHWFMPSLIKLRRDVRDADQLIMPEVKSRTEKARKALEAGKKLPKTADTIGWLYEIAGEKGEELNLVAAQLSLTMAAIHTTSEAMSFTLLDLCIYPELVQPLREEIIEVIGGEGWTKNALYKLKHLDSFLKESQRFHMSNAVSMHRAVLEPIPLSDGSVLPRGARIMVATSNWDENIYANPDSFDAWRFFHEREKPQQQNAWQHVTVADHSQLSFGYGNHACPGRFFASTEIKIALSHLLLKYDWYFEGTQIPLMEFETSASIAPECKIQLRRRNEEIPLDLDDIVA